MGRQIAHFWDFVLLQCTKPHFKQAYFPLQLVPNTPGKIRHFWKKIPSISKIEHKWAVVKSHFQQIFSTFFREAEEGLPFQKICPSYFSEVFWRVFKLTKAILAPKNHVEVPPGVLEVRMFPTGRHGSANRVSQGLTHNFTRDQIGYSMII
jgi:hypothetical protein